MFLTGRQQRWLFGARCGDRRGVLDGGTLWGVYKLRSHRFVVPNRVCFGKKICQISSAWLSDANHYALLHLMTDPVVAHVNGLRALLFNCQIGDANGARVVTDNDGTGLWVAEVMQDVSLSCAGDLISSEK